MNRRPLRGITEEEIRTFEDDGVVCVRGVLDGEWVARMQRATDEILDHPTKFGQDMNEADEGGRYAFDHNMWLFRDEFRAFIYESPRAEVAAKILRSKVVNLIFDFLLVKEPHSPTPTTWHHDMPGNPVEGNSCGMWLSLDHVTSESGAVEWVRGSHKWGKRFDTVGDGRTKREGYGYIGDKPVLEAMPDIAGNRDKYDIVSFETFPGDFPGLEPAYLSRRPRQRYRPTPARFGRPLRRRGVDLRGAHWRLVQPRSRSRSRHCQRRSVPRCARPPCVPQIRPKLGRPGPVEEPSHVVRAAPA